MNSTTDLDVVYEHNDVVNNNFGGDGSIITMKGLLGATLTIFLTTLEDAIWLVPFCLYASTFTIRFIHSLLFVGTFTFLSTFICIVTIVLQYFSTKTITATTSSSSSNLTDTISLYSSMIGATLCWLIGFYFYWKKFCKRKRKEQQKQQEKLQQQHVDEEIENQPLLSSLSTPNNSGGTFSNDNDAIKTTTTSNHDSNNQYPVLVHNIENHQQQHLVEQTEENDNENGNQNSCNKKDTNNNRITSIHIVTVITLTIIGALDEVSYFPSLLLGNIFTSYEIIIGTIFASLLELSVVFFFLSLCQPILHFLDQIPIYYVIFFFAIILSCEVIWDLLLL